MNGWKRAIGIPGLFAGILCGAQVGATPVPMYETYSGYFQDYFYSIQPAQRDIAVSYGYEDHGTQFYVENAQIPGTLPFQRFWLGSPYVEHFYTAIPAEVERVGTYGYTREGIEGYIPLYQIPGTVPLYRLFWHNADWTDFAHKFTINAGVYLYYSGLGDWGWQGDGIVGYVWPAPPATLPWDAKVVVQNIPTFIEAGVPTPVSVTMRNTGTNIWNIGEWFLGTQMPQDTKYWCFQNSDQPNRAALPHNILPGQDVTFNITVLPGYCYQYLYQPHLILQMMSPIYGWIGERTRDMGVTTVGASAEYVAPMNVVTVMQPETSYQVQITMKNTGVETWTESGGYRLGSQNPQDNLAWGTRRATIPVGQAVFPGQQHTFVFNVVAPAAEGIYNFQWQMVHDGDRWMGQRTPNVLIRVARPPAGRGMLPPGSPPPVDPAWSPPPYNPFRLFP